MVDINNNSLKPYMPGAPKELSKRLLEADEKTDNLQTVARTVNFWPRCTALNRWYSVGDWQAIDDATFYHEQSFGDATLPVIPASHISGVILPFDAVVTSIDLWGITASATSVTEFTLFKFPLVEGAAGAGTAVQIGSSIILGPTAANKLVDVAIDVNPGGSAELSRGDMLLLCARESVVAGSTPRVAGTITFKQR